MIKNLSRVLGAAVIAAAFSSCYYSPYASGYYSSGGYYDDASYGGSIGTNFVYTSSSYWLYDPVVRCYYDRRRHCYYDPWVNGYYPRGYCPRPIVHAPHPRGWNGRGTIAPPGTVRDRPIDRYRDRLAAYKARNIAWAANARHRDVGNYSSWQTRRAQAAANYRNQQQQEADRGPRGNGGRQPANASNPGWGNPSWGNRAQTPSRQASYADRVRAQQEAMRQRSVQQQQRTRAQYQQQQQNRAQYQQQRQQQSQPRQRAAPQNNYNQPVGSSGGGNRGGGGKWAEKQAERQLNKQLNGGRY